MKKWNKSLAIAAAICIGTAGFTATALAASPQAEFGSEYADDNQMPSEKKGGDRHEARWKESMTKRHAELHDKLKLSANQESAWKTYTDATMKNMAQPKSRSPMDFDAMSAPDRMQKGLDFMKERQARMESQLSALKTFYATLTPEQQKIFDKETSQKQWHEKAKERKQKRSGNESY